MAVPKSGPNRVVFAEEMWPLQSAGLTLEDFVNSYLIDYNGRRAVQRLGVWKGHEAAVAELLLQRDDVQVELSRHQVVLTQASIPAIRARAIQGLYQLAVGAESEAVRLSALSRLLDVVGVVSEQAQAPDMADKSQEQLVSALNALGVTLPA